VTVGHIQQTALRVRRCFLRTRNPTRWTKPALATETNLMRRATDFASILGKAQRFGSTPQRFFYRRICGGGYALWQTQEDRPS
jgi:hypothetical protein